MRIQACKLVLFSVLPLSLLALAGCGGHSGISAAQQVASISVTCATCLFPNGATNVQFAPSGQVIMDIAEGQTEAITPTVLGFNGQALSGPMYPITYTSDDPSAVTVSPSGLVCAGVWDAQYINCQPGTIPFVSTNDKYPGTGTLTMPTATPTPNAAVTPSPTPSASATPYPGPKLTIATIGGGGGSVTITVKIHPVISNIQVGTTTTGAPGSNYPYNAAQCLSQNQQTQLTATAIGTVSSQTVQGVSGTQQGDVSFDVGFFSWHIDNLNVAVISPTGEVVPRSPGVAYVSAQVSQGNNGNVSQPFPIVVCPVHSIQLGVLAGNPPVPTPTVFAMNVGDSASVFAAVTDTQGQSVATANLKFASSQPAIIPFTASGGVEGTIAAAGPGAFSLVAACTPPTCNGGPTGNIYGLPGGPVSASTLGFGYPVYSNLLTGNIAGTSITNVYVTGSVDLPNVAGTPTPTPHPNYQLLVLNGSTLATLNTIPLPYAPNSLVFDPQGQNIYLGTNDTLTGATLMELGAGSTVVTRFAGKINGNTNVTTVTGTVLAVSPDGLTIIVSDLVNGALFVVSKALNAAQYYPYAGITSASFSPDSSTAFLSGSSGVFALSTHQEILQQFVNSGTNLNSSVAFLPEGLAAVASNVSGDETAYATCNNAVATTTPVASNAGLLASFLTSTGATRVLGANDDGSGWLDTTVTATQPAPPPAACTPAVTLSATSVTATLDTCTPAAGPTQITALNNGSAVFVTGTNPGNCTAVSAVPMYNVGTATAGSINLSAPGILTGGSATLDSNTLFVGTVAPDFSSASLHQINLAGGANTDALQVSIPFIPTLIAVQPK